MRIRLKLIVIIILFNLFDGPLYGQFKFVKNNDQVIGFSISKSGEHHIDTVKDSLPSLSTWIRHENIKYGISCLLPPGFILVENTTISDTSLVIRDTLHKMFRRDAIVIQLSDKSFYFNARLNSFGINDGNYDIINEVSDSIFFSNPMFQSQMISLGRMGMQARADYFELQDMKCVRGDNSVGRYGESYEGLEEVKRAFASKKYSKQLSLVMFYETVESNPNPIKEYRFYQIILSIKYI